MLREELVGKAKLVYGKMQKASGDELTSLQKEFDGYSTEIDRCDRMANIAAREASAVEAKDKNILSIFSKLMHGEDAGQDASALAVRNGKFLGDKPQTSFRIPGGLAMMLQAKSSLASRAAIGTNEYGAPNTSGITSFPGGFNPFAGPEALIQYPELAALVKLGYPPHPILDQATKIPALTGAAIPVLGQTLADPFAGVTISKIDTLTNEGTTKDATLPPSIRRDVYGTTEYEAAVIMTNLALRRAPSYEGVLTEVLMEAIYHQVEVDLYTAIIDSLNVQSYGRAVNSQVSWADIIGMEALVPFYWAVNGQFCMSQTARAYLNATLAPVVNNLGGVLFAENTSQSMFTKLNDKKLFLNTTPILGTRGDVIYGDFKNAYVGVAEEPTMHRTDQGATLTAANSTMFAVFAHLGIDLPVPKAFVVLDVNGTAAENSSDTDEQ